MKTVLFNYHVTLQKAWSAAVAKLNWLDLRNDNIRTYRKLTKEEQSEYDVATGRHEAIGELYSAFEKELNENE